MNNTEKIIEINGYTIPINIPLIDGNKQSTFKIVDGHVISDVTDINIPLEESQYNGNDVILNQPMKGDIKKYKVYVKNPDTGNIVKIDFGSDNQDDSQRNEQIPTENNSNNVNNELSPKNWDNKNISDLLKEMIEPNDVDVTSLQYHNKLNPLIWQDENKLHPEIRKKLLENAIEFIKYSNLGDIKIYDIILVGSLANYNYTNSSDLDVHIVIDYNDISDNVDLVSELLKFKKNTWNNNYDIKIKDYDVEMYYQDVNQKHISSGTYSILKNHWITKPIYKIINIDTQSIKEKVVSIVNQIDSLEKLMHSSKFLDMYNKLKTKIKTMRQSGLDKKGEFSNENLTFKLLRNTGYLNKLNKLKNRYIENKLNLSEKLN